MKESVLGRAGVRGGGRATGTIEYLKQMATVARRKQGKSHEEWTEFQGNRVGQHTGVGFASRRSGKLSEGFLPKAPSCCCVDS